MTQNQLGRKVREGSNPSSGTVRYAAGAPRPERSGTVRDPFGHEWNIGHEIEAVTPTEMQRRYDELMKA